MNITFLNITENEYKELINVTEMPKQMEKVKICNEVDAYNMSGSSTNVFGGIEFNLLLDVITPLAVSILANYLYAKLQELIGKRGKKAEETAEVEGAPIKIKIDDNAVNIDLREIQIAIERSNVG